MRIILLHIIALIALSSCSKKMKEKVGIVTTGPNEYKVQREKSLEVPPHYDLFEPNDNVKNNSSNKVVDSLNESEKALLDEVDRR